MRRFSSGHLPQSRALKLCTALEGTTITAAIILFLRALRRLDFWMSPNHRSVFQGCRLHHPASVSDRRRLAERKERHSVLANTKIILAVSVQCTIDGLTVTGIVNF